MDNDNFLVFVINGGAGKNVLATAVIKAIKNHDSSVKIIIITAYKDVWVHNPNVYRVYQQGQMPYFYSDFIKNKKTKIVSIEPYSTSDYILANKHLIEIWCELAGVKYNNEQPELFFNNREVEFVQRRFLDGRKIMIMQTNGGFNPDMKISWMRDMPLDLAQDVVNTLVNKYRIIHIRRDDQPFLNGVEQFHGSLRDLFLLIRFSEKRLLIDSLAQHVASALKKPSTVLWIRNSPEVLGYAIHDNIKTRVEDEIDTLSNSILEPYDIGGNIYQCPFKEGTKLFELEEVLNSIEKQTNQPNT